MDNSSYENMERNVGIYFPSTPMLVADLGSYDVNGTYKAIVAPKWSYVGIDLASGPNVDMVMEKEYSIPVPDNNFDALISGNCFEHVRNPFKLMKEVGRVVKPGGMIIVTVPLDQAEHRFPVDCWRILGDGWRSLFDESGIETVMTEYVTKIIPRENRRNQTRKDSWAIGRIK